MSYYISVDLGASSATILMAHIEQGEINFTVIHRFDNYLINKVDKSYWDIQYIFEEIITGLQKVKDFGVDECTLGIDSWAVDYCFIGKNGQLLAKPRSYRDARTVGIPETFFEKINKESIYRKTGIQFLDFNTIYQLYVEDKELMNKVDTILMIPDYLNYMLTGNMYAEITNVSTTQLMNIESQDYDDDLLKIIGISREKFPPVISPGKVIGGLRSSLKDNYRLPNTKVIAVGSHDTASAVAGTPASTEGWAFLSSGTWSLIGTENSQPIITKESLQLNYTNEMGVENTYRFLKNISGMWYIQEIARNLNYQYSYEELAELASEVEPYQQTLNLNEKRFMQPANMINEIQNACKETNQPVPETVGELVMAIYSNLAITYSKEIDNLEKLSKEIDTIHIVGGGSNVDILNQMTASLTKKKVVTGPSEASGIGNILIQMISNGVFKNIEEARKWLSNQLNLQVYLP